MTGAALGAQREALAAERRRQRRLLRQSLRRYSGHSMRRGQVRHQQRLGVPRHIIETTNRYRPGSKALSRYRDGLVSWQDNPTVLMRQQGRAAPPLSSSRFRNGTAGLRARHGCSPLSNE
ncbi:hypothetical protein [Streptomyces mirabilis]|uniref:hypothetical protein n=1 Tax=Streptomyces mirabilis TaxID=68239 RepID=UPI0022534365|nr:hypothetical protein [Streptomyces mirabilis]MCX4428920.1 hypothetical protein [Streptomyces mirabilis]